MSRFIGYAGVVLLLGGLISAAVLPHSTSVQWTRDAVNGAAAIGYGLVTLRLLALAITGSTSRDRLLGGVGFLCLVVGAIAFVGSALILTTGGPA